ncbi:MAG: metallophosphoesterase [Legionellaceae bacterium]|nr:metallophosphoesterase [Legionellaceae bacterium]
MNTNKIAWVTDIHLNFLKSAARKKFYKHVIETGADQILITGDIAEATNVCELLQEFVEVTGKSIYFVLGNHDYYHNSVAHVREKITALCKQNKKLIWLGEPKVVTLSNDAILLGHDGWADARYGDFEHSPINLNDSRLIAELYQAFLLSKSALKYEMQKLADQDAKILEETITKAITANIKQVIIATHVPPFPECSWHKDHPSDKDWLPYFASKATGDVIMAAARTYANVQFLVLCGHTHTATSIDFLDNLKIRAGGAEYYKPEVQDVIIV